MASSSPFLERVSAAVRVRHYSIRTEQTYIYWIRPFIQFHQRRHSGQLGEVEVAAFLCHPALDEHVAPATQNQALNALVFLCDAVLKHPLGDMPGVVRAKAKLHLPVVLSVEEVARVLWRGCGCRPACSMARACVSWRACAWG